MVGVVMDLHLLDLVAVVLVAMEWRDRTVV
jgi:hypothetical protein